MSLLETIEHKGFKIEIHADEFPMNPCEDFDEFGLMVCFHNRYNLGHYNHKDNEWSKHNDVDGYKEFLEENKDNLIVLPLYLYDHSGISMSTELTYPFNDMWDAGQVGMIHISKDKVLEAYNVKRISKKTEEKVLEGLRAQVNEYHQYISGQVYGYIVKDNDDDEIASCWGFFGFDHEKSGLMSEAKSAIEYELSKIGE